MQLLPLSFLATLICSTFCLLFPKRILLQLLANALSEDCPGRQVCIPGSSGARRLHSSEDLRLLVYDKPLRQQGRTSHNGGAPASAPAAPSHLALSPKRAVAQAAPPAQNAQKPAKTPFEAAAGEAHIDNSYFSANPAIGRVLTSCVV